MSREQDMVINERNFYRDENEVRKKFSRQRAFLYCCCCLLLLVGLFLTVKFVMMLTTRFAKGKDKSNSYDLPHSNAVSSEKHSDFLPRSGRLCENLGNDDKFTTNNIYIIKGAHNLTEVQACGIESVLRLFPDKTIYVIDFNKYEKIEYDRCSYDPNYLGLLLYLYKDRIELVIADKEQFFRNTPLQNLTKTEKHFEFLAMLLTAYKYGGFVFLPNMVMGRRDFIDCIPEETIVEPFTMLSTKKCDDFLMYLMQTFSVCGSLQNTTLDDVISQSIQLYSNSLTSNSHAPKRLKPKEVCDKSAEGFCQFMRLCEFKDKETRWISDVSSYCKQVIQAFLGLRMNQMEVDEETARIKTRLNKAR